MLQRIGDVLQGQRWLAFVVLGMIGLVFVAWGASGFVGDMLGVPGGYAAKVNGEEISAAEVNRVWQQQQPRYLEIYGGEIPEGQRKALQDQVLDGFIRDTLVLSRARDLGYRVTADQLRKAYQDEQAFQVDGKFSADVARSRLAAAGITVQEFEADLRRSLLSNQLAATIGATDFLTQAETRRLVSLQDEQRELRYALFEPAQFAGSAPVDEAQARAWHEAHAADFTVPDTVKLAFAELTLADVTAKVAVTEQQARDRYTQNSTAYIEPEQRQARHILITAEDGRDDAAAKALAESLREKAVGGADFATLARENSKDAASAAQGGDLGFATRDVYVPEFADALFALKAGEISPVVKSPFGWHVIRLEEVREGSTRPFEDARPEIEATLRRELAADEFGQRQEQMQKRIEAGSGDFERLVDEFGLTRGEVEQFRRDAGGLPLGSDPELIREVFGDAVLNQRRVGGPLPIGEERLVIFRVTDFKPSYVRPLAEVREAVVAAVREDRGRQAARAAATEALAKLQAGQSMDQVLAPLKVRAEPARAVGRGDPQLPVEVRDAAFAARKPEGAPVSAKVDLDQGGAALLQVLAVRDAPEPANPQLQILRAQRELQRTGMRDVEGYVSALLKDAKVTRNTQVFQ
jgi:peptidyl-prolyl cis-trans isomerase D